MIGYNSDGSITISSDTNLGASQTLPPGSTPAQIAATVAAVGAQDISPPRFVAMDVSFFGADPRAPSRLVNAFQAAINALSADGGAVLVPNGNYSSFDPSSLSSSGRAITWISFGATLPAGMPGRVVSLGTKSLPETSIQSNRNVQVHSYEDLGAIAAVLGTRQYVYHVTGFLHSVPGNPSELEARAFSFDLGTDQVDIVDAIRGMKGRVYATAGKSNIRAIYGFAESTSGGSHTGNLTGLLGTVYRNGSLNTDGDSIAVRGHVDAGATACFQAASGVTGGAAPSYGYTIRTGSGTPLLPAVAGYQSHGGGAGAMYLGYRTHLDLTVAYEVNNKARVHAEGGFRSGQMTISDQSVGVVTPPKSSGIVSFFLEGNDQTDGIAWFRVSGTALLRMRVNGTLVTSGTAVIPNGTTGAAGSLNVYAVNDGNLYFENRTGGSRSLVWRFDIA